MRKFKQPLPDTVPETTPVRPPSSATEARGRSSQNGFLTADNHDISVALMIAMLFPGGGQIYNGQIGKGVLLIILTLADLIFTVLRVQAPALLLLNLALCFALWLLAILDSAVIARRLIRHQPVRVWQWF